MRELIYIPLIVCVLAALCARSLSERLPPRTATWLLTVSAVVLAGASCAAVGLLAMAAALRLPLVASLGGLSRPVLAHLDPAPLVLGEAAAGLFACAAANAALAAFLRVAALIAVHREARRLPGDGQIVVIEDRGADAYAVPASASPLATLCHAEPTP